MQEAVATLPSGLEIAYETFGDPRSRPLLLIMGLGGPALWWDEALCERLAERDFYVIRYDNRDIGRSSWLRQKPVSRRKLVQAVIGRKAVAPYTMSDLADDAFGLLDHLDIDRAHVTGVSMGGMVAQTMAIRRPRRVLSLVSMMSTTGRRTVGWQDPRLLPLLFGSRQASRDAYVKGSDKVWKAIGSPAYPSDEQIRRARAGDTFDRGVDAAGVVRQMMAVVTQPDRTADLARLRIPATVIHGTADKMVHPSGGRATAAAIPGAELVMIRGMGHDLPPALHDLFADAIQRTAERSRSEASTTQASTTQASTRQTRANSSSSASRR